MHSGKPFSSEAERTLVGLLVSIRKHRREAMKLIINQIKPKEPAVNPTAQKKANSSKSLLPLGIVFRATEIR